MPSPTYYYFKFYIYKYYIETKELTLLNESYLNDRNNGVELLNFNYLINKNFLYVKYAFNLDIYDINQDLKLINEINIYQYYCQYRSSFKSPFTIRSFKCNYDDDLFIGKDDDDKLKFYKFENMSFKVYNIFPFSNEETENIIKLKDGNFVLSTEKDIILLKKYN